MKKQTSKYKILNNKNNKFYLKKYINWQIININGKKIDINIARSKIKEYNLKIYKYNEIQNNAKSACFAA